MQEKENPQKTSIDERRGQRSLPKRYASAGHHIQLQTRVSLFNRQNKV